MSEEPSDPYETVLPLQRVLATHGVQASPWALVEACSGDLSLPSFANCARQLGLQATVCEVRPRDFGFLAKGTLVALDRGEVAIVVEHGPDGVTLESVDGTRKRVGKGSAARTTLALELRPPPPDGAGLVARLAARTKHEPHFTRAVALSALFALALLGLGLAGPMLTREALAAALPDHARSELGLLAAALGFVGVQLAYVGWLRRRAQLYLSTKLAEIGSVDVVAHALELPFAKLAALEVSGAQQAARSAASAAEALPAFAEQLVDAVLGLGFLACTFVIDPRSGVVAAGAGAVLFVAGALRGRTNLALRRELLTRTRAEQQSLFETLAGIETVKSESAERKMLTRWLARLVAEEETALATRLSDSRFEILHEVMERTVFVGVLLYMAKRCLDADAPVADLVAAIQLTSTFMSQMRKLAQLPVALSTFRSDVERADELLSQRAARITGGRLPPDTRAPAIVVRDAWFRYDDASPWVLRNLDLVVEPGETVMLQWPSGKGKSTLLRLLSGLLEPSRGDVLLFGIEARQARRMVTYVPQQSYLFPASLMENLRILSGGASIQRIFAAARATGLMDLVSTWPMGLETVVSLGASNISSGQRQLVLFTAAAAAETPIVLLDEALAHVDIALRARLGVADLFRGRTVVAVAHDASSREREHARQLDTTSHV